jgi:hypothetical protein
MLLHNYSWVSSTRQINVVRLLYQAWFFFVCSVLLVYIVSSFRVVVPIAGKNEKPKGRKNLRTFKEKMGRCIIYKNLKLIRSRKPNCMALIWNSIFHFWKCFKNSVNTIQLSPRSRVFCITLIVVDLQVDATLLMRAGNLITCEKCRHWPVNSSK